MQWKCIFANRRAPSTCVNRGGCVTGYRLILLTDRGPGKETKFYGVKVDYCDRLRQALLSRLRPAAKIVLHPPPKS